MNDAYRQFVETYEGTVRTDVLLGPYTTYKIGGPADLFVEAHTKQELVDAVTNARNLHIPVFVLGGGTNILVSDKGFRGLVVKNATGTINVVGVKGMMAKGTKMDVVYLEAESGVIFNKLVRYTIDEGLAGLEMHLGLPGSVGGAIYMNSKWSRVKAAVGDVVYQATILTPTNTIEVVPRSYFHFQYGKSILQKTGDILLSVVFTLTKSTKETLWQRAEESIAYRRQTQPQGVCTAGCVFKNISLSEAIKAATPEHTTSTGFLLDKAGCKGLTSGGAKYSLVHANFIETQPGATASDVLQLIETGKTRVKDTFGVTLNEEIQLIGDFS